MRGLLDKSYGVDDLLFPTGNINLMEDLHLGFPRDSIPIIKKEEEEEEQAVQMRYPFLLVMEKPGWEGMVLW